VASQAISLTAALRRAKLDLDAVGARYALVGGLAVSARAEPRLTRDVDLVVAVEDDAEAEAIVRAMAARGYRVTSVVEQTRTSRLATARLSAPHAMIVVDLLFASSGIEQSIVAASDQLKLLPGLQMPVARTGHLIAMKLLARDDRERPQDLDDLRALIAVANRADRELVVAAIEQIEARGFSRGRSLAAMWRTLTRRTAPRATRGARRASRTLRRRG
jgi:hypothetical protein